ncbi:MAG TPA: EAL domain-containing protein [Candidatus Limnocylindria bacterium]|jgi:diguanylate cyclase (GGDEF)-like protein/PAS domain S-box-containing protein|nr:EAL domain-containing protein [Candidatus Limnocylindria bacterium]
MVRLLDVFARGVRALGAGVAGRPLHVLDAVGDGVYVVDARLRLTHCNAQAERMLDAPAAALVGRPLETLAGALLADLVPEIILARCERSIVERTRAVADPESWIEVRITPLGRETIVALRDVTERTRAELRSRESELRVRLVTENVDAALWTTDRAARFTTIAGGVLRDLELRAEDLLGASCGALLAEHLLEDVYRGTPLRAENARGERWLHHQVEPLRDEQGAVIGAVGVSIDITERKRAEQQLFESAYRDRLTGLPNRLSLEQRLTDILAQSSRDGTACGLLFVDLDRFKTINETLGHGIGDDVLVEVVARLQEALRPGDVLARQGGDEFIVLLTSVSGAVEAELIARRLVGAFAAPIAARGRELYVNASVGAALFPEHGRNGEALVAHADAAMQRAKTRGGNRWAIYDATMELAAAERLTLETELRGAIAREELRLLYQPVVDLRTRRIVGCEALLRWEHRTRGTIHPATFIPIAEETGAIIALDRWVLREAVAAAARLRRLVPEFRVAINLSPHDLREPDLPDAVAGLLGAHGLPASALGVELTEHVALEEHVVPTLRRLCALGLHVALDDFGTGYSALSYLKRLPITALKIDRAFIRDVAGDAYDQAIVGSIVGVAKALGLHVTAEGLETDEQAAFVASLGCEEGQGYRFGVPQTLDALERRLTRYDCDAISSAWDESAIG